jgi:hypothetical protein
VGVVVHWQGGFISRCEVVRPVRSAGTYDVSAAFTRAGDYGIAALAPDGRPLGEPMDLYTPYPRVVSSGPVAFGTVELSAGSHVLTVTEVDKNPKSTAYFFGLDWIRLTRVGPGREAGPSRHDSPTGVPGHGGEG